MSLREILLVPLIAVVAAAPGAAQLGAPVGTAEAPDATALRRTIDGFAARLAADAAVDSVGSIAAAVVIRDSLAWAGAFGPADGRNGDPATPETVYRAASITKIATAATLMRLVERGVISLDEPVAVRVPEIAGLAGLQVRDRPITYRDLASHTAGLEREPSGSFAARGGRSGWRRKTLASIPLTEVRSPPGTTYRYSNIGYAILGLALERASGVPFQRLVEREVLAPLGLARTSFEPPGRGSGRLATGFVNLEDGIVDPRVPRAEHRGRGYKLPSEGLYSTTVDLARLIMALSGAHGDRLLGAASRAAMMADQDPDGDGRSGYGLGLQLTRIGDVRVVGHSGTVAGYSSYLAFDPDARTGVVILRSYNRGATNLAAEAHRLLLELAAGR